MNKLVHLPQFLYHGTTSQYIYLKDTSKIDFNYGDEFSDFGQGFYLTSIYEQALNWARFKVKLNSRFTTNKIIHPIIIKYKLDVESMLQNCDGIVLAEPNEKWAEFIYNNRVKSIKSISEFHNKDKRYDYIYGHLADGKLAIAIDRYSKSKFNIHDLLKDIFPYYPNSNDQLSLHSSKVINHLKYLETIHDTSYRKR